MSRVAPITLKNWQDTPSLETPVNKTSLQDLETRLSSYVGAHASQHAPTGEDPLTIADLPSTLIVSAPGPSGDETGIIDTAALEAAQPAKGVLLLKGGNYYVNKLPTCGPGQGIQGSGFGTTIYMVGTGICWRVYNPSFPVSGPIGIGLSPSNVIAPSNSLYINGERAGPESIGIQIGDTNGLDLNTILVAHFNKSGSENWAFKNEVGWCERLNITNCHSIDGSRCVTFSFTGETYSQSFDYSKIDIGIAAAANQHGIVMEKDVQFTGCNLRFYGNFNTGVGSNTGVVWKFGTDNSAVGIFASQVNMQFEVDGTGVAHKTIERGTAAELRGYGCLQFGKKFVAGNVTRPQTAITFSGYINVDSNFGLRSSESGEGLNVQGSSTWSRGFSSVSEGKLKIGTQGGDYFVQTLANGVNILNLNHVVEGSPRRIVLLLTQPATGEPGTVLWSEPGNNESSKAQVVRWTAGGGTTPELQTTAGALDAIELLTTDGINWYAFILPTRIGTSQLINESITRPKIKLEAVAEPQLASAAVTERTMGNEVVAKRNIAAKSVDSFKLLSPLIKPTKAAEGSVQLQTEPHPSRTIVAALTGNGSKTEWEIEHKLGSTMLQLSVQEGSGEEPAKAIALSEWHANGNEKVIIRFSIAPSAGAEYFVSITA